MHESDLAGRVRSDVIWDGSYECAAFVVVIDGNECGTAR